MVFVSKKKKSLKKQKQNLAIYLSGFLFNTIIFPNIRNLFQWAKIAKGVRFC